MTSCLDSWAVLRWLEGAEPAARVAATLDDRPLMSWINLGEVWYVVARRAGTKEANRVVDLLRHGLTMDEPSADRVLEAAAIKAEHRLAYADAFALATAAAYGVPLLTGDPEILACDGPWEVVDCR